MPEGHTLRKLADDLTAAFAGRAVRVSSPQGRFAADAEQVDGSRVIGAESAGKHLFLEVDGERFVHVHLGLIGRFDVHVLDAGAQEVPAPVGAVRLRLVTVPEAGRPTAYADLRGAILCDLVGPDKREQVLARLGPDPLRDDADPGLAWRRISRSPRAIGDLLMDQKVLAGVGNVYRAEVLFRHGIHPLRQAPCWEIVRPASGTSAGIADTRRRCAPPARPYARKWCRPGTASRCAGRRRPRPRGRRDGARGPSPPACARDARCRCVRCARPRS